MAKDSLAAGAKSATFGPNKKVAQSDWDKAFKNFNPSKFKMPSKKKKGARHGVGNTNV